MKIHRLNRSGNPSEDLEQSAFIEWCRINRSLHPGLPWAFFIPTGDFLNYFGGLPAARRAQIFKASEKKGLIKGVPDIFIPAPIPPKHGIFVEMKKLNGQLSPDQIWLHQILTERGYDVITAFGFESARRQVIEIINRGQ